MIQKEKFTQKKTKNIISNHRHQQATHTSNHLKKKKEGRFYKSRSKKTDYRYPNRCKASRRASHTIQKTVPETNNPILEKPEEEPEASENQEKEEKKNNAIKY